MPNQVGINADFDFSALSLILALFGAFSHRMKENRELEAAEAAK